MDYLVPSPDLLFRCMKAGHLNQRELATVLGTSDRTVSRWLGGGAGTLVPAQFHALARAAFPGDRALAAELAALGNSTLEGLGLVQAPPAPRPATAPAPAAAPPPVAPVQPPPAILDALLDSIVCAAADLHSLPSREIRPMVAAAFARAVELGLTVEAVATGFAAKSKKV